MIAAPREARLRTVRHASEQGAWRMDFLTPHPALAASVRRFNAYAEHGTRFTRRRELPHGHAVLVFNLGAELRVEHPADTRTAFAAGTGFYSGASARYAITETDRAQRGVQVVLTLPGARRLLGFPLAEIGDRVIDAADLFGTDARDLLGRLGDARAHAARLMLLEEAVTRRIAEAPDPAADLLAAYESLWRSGGRAGIGKLAARLGCSRRHLTSRFHREFGLPPKLLGRVFRFGRAVRLIAAGRADCWADLAAAAGYADQPHMAREFRALAGSPPAAFLHRRLPDEGGFVD